jgi:hypothetical protein
MRVEQRDGTTERKIIIGMIIDPAVLGRIAPRWGKDTLKSKWSNLVGGWCVRHWQLYGRPPGKDIEGLFTAWADDSKDTETVGLVESFLHSLSGEYEALARDFNSQFVLDMADKYLNEVKARRTIELAAGHLDGGDLDLALAALESWARVETASERPVDLLQDMNEVDAAFEQKDMESIIEYPGDLGVFFGDQLCRDAFVCFMGPEKRGKTWALLDVAWTAMTQRRKVAFFGAGDMTKRQVIRRLGVRAAAVPLKPRTVKWPTDIVRHPDEKQAEVKYEEKRFEHGITKAQAREAFESIAKSRVRSDQSYLRIACHPNNTLTMGMVKDELRAWERQGWGTADVVVIDYADIMVEPKGSRDEREGIDQNWREMRALSQTLHGLVVTATQTKASSYDAKTIEMKHFADLKKKLAHVTGAIGLSQTILEKQKGIMRYNWVVLREDENNPYRCCNLAQCLALGNPRVRSTF